MKVFFAVFIMIYLVGVFAAVVGVIINTYEAIYTYFTGPEFGYFYDHYAKWALICLAIAVVGIAIIGLFV